MGNYISTQRATTAQGSGLSPSSTAESANKVIEVDVPGNGSRPPSIGNISCDKPPEEPESVDTSYGVEATAVRKLAASTGTVAILGTTAQTPSKEQSAGFVEADHPGETDSSQQKVEEIENGLNKGPNEQPAEQIVAENTPKISSKADGADGIVSVLEPQKSEEATSKLEAVEQERQADSPNELDDTVRTINKQQVPEITETLVASLEASPVEEGYTPIMPPSEVAEESTPDTRSEKADEITKAGGKQTEQEDSPASTKPPAPSDETKSENNDSTSTKTVDNDISSEQLKTNSLSDLSISELDEKESTAQEQKTSEQKTVENEEKKDELSGESEKSESDLKVTELTCESPSESSQPITKEESTSDVTTDNQHGESQLLGDEELLVSEGSDDDISKRNKAAIKIQSSFRGFHTRKYPPVGGEKGDDEEEENKLTESEMENVKVEVEGMMKEAEETTESLRNTPDIDNELSTNVDEDFPAPPDDALLNEIEANEGSGDTDKDTTSLNLETVPYPNSDADGRKSKDLSDSPSSSDQKQLLTDNGDNTTADLARMTADEDLPAPDFELLESSCTDDLNTEIINSEKVLEDDHHDSTEGDLTIDEDSEKLKQIQKPQECDELNNGDKNTMGNGSSTNETPDQNAAAAKIQANVRGFLARKQAGKEMADGDEGILVVGAEEESNQLSSNATVSSDNIVTASQQNASTERAPDQILEPNNGEAETSATDEPVREEESPSSPNTANKNGSPDPAIKPAEEKEPIPETIIDVSKSPEHSSSVEADLQPSNSVVVETVAEIRPSELESNSSARALSEPETCTEEIEHPVDEGGENALVTSNTKIADAEIEPASKQDAISASAAAISNSSDAQEISSREQPKDTASERTIDEVQDMISSHSDSISLDTASQDTIEEQKDKNPNTEMSTHEPSEHFLELTHEISSEEGLKRIESAALSEETISQAEVTSPPLDESPESVGEEKPLNALSNAKSSEVQSLNESNLDTLLSQPLETAVQTNGIDAALLAEKLEETNALGEQFEKNVVSRPDRTSAVEDRNVNEPSSPKAEIETEKNGSLSPGSSLTSENNNEVKSIVSAETKIVNGDSVETAADQLLNASATKIQANVRGYLSRKKQSALPADQH